MLQQGLKSPFDIADLSIIGLAAIPRKLPLILRRIRETADAVIAAKPEALGLDGAVCGSGGYFRVLAPPCEQCREVDSLICESWRVDARSFYSC